MVVIGNRFGQQPPILAARALPRSDFHVLRELLLRGKKSSLSVLSHSVCISPKFFLPFSRARPLDGLLTDMAYAGKEEWSR